MRITIKQIDGQQMFIALTSYDERQKCAALGFQWNNILRGAWATWNGSIAFQNIHLCDADTLRLFRDNQMAFGTEMEMEIAITDAGELTKKHSAQLMSFFITSDQNADIHEALRYLASVCDGANKRDHVGFNGTDSEFGKDLARRDSLSPMQAAYAKLMLKKYRKQLPPVLYAAIFPEIVAADEAKAAEKAARKADRKKTQSVPAKEKIRLYCCVLDCGRFVRNVDSICSECEKSIELSIDSRLNETAFDAEIERVQVAEAGIDEMEQVPDCDAWRRLGF